MNRNRLDLLVATSLIALLCAPLAARATMLLPGGDTYLNGAFDDLRYGATGAAYVTPFLYLGDLSSTDAPSDHALTTDLGFTYFVTGLGTSAATIEYRIINEGIESFEILRFMLNVQADGSNSFADFVSVAFGAGAPGEPDQFQVGDFSVDPLASLIALDDATDGSDACGALVCDADLALQWDLGVLDPGEIWIIRAALSEDGSSLSSRNLTATSADTDATVLTFSGVARVVPEPATAVLVAAGLALLRHRRAHAR